MQNSGTVVVDKDEKRRSFKGEELYKKLGGWLFLDVVKAEIAGEKGTLEEKAALNSDQPLWDRLEPYVRHRENSPMVRDVFRGCTLELAMCYVNDGANDFNQAEEKTNLSPSIVMAKRFGNYRAHAERREEELRKLFENEETTGGKKVFDEAKFEQYKLGDKILQEDYEDINDVLYVYRMLKEHPKGLNYEIIKKRDLEFPEEKNLETMSRMDALLAIPEEERFHPKAQSEKSKNGFWRSLFGSRGDR